MRLTKKEKIEELANFVRHNVILTNVDFKELKLGQLENIEDDLGIGLITLFNEIKETQAYEIILLGIVDSVKRKLGIKN